MMGSPREMLDRTAPQASAAVVISRKMYVNQDDPPRRFIEVLKPLPLAVEKVSVLPVY
jgi:hypothetical protein